EDRPRGRPLEPGDHPEQRGLAAAGRPEEDEELALLGREIHSVDRADVAEVLADRSRLYRGQIKPAPSPSTCRRYAGRPCRLPGAPPRAWPRRPAAQTCWTPSPGAAAPLASLANTTFNTQVPKISSMAALA